MITFRRCALATVLVMLSSASVLRAQESERDLTVVNSTGRDIFELYMAPANSELWSSELLDEHEELEDGATFSVSRLDADGCLIDVKVVYMDDDSEAVWKEVDACQSGAIVLTSEAPGSTPTSLN